MNEFNPLPIFLRELRAGKSVGEAAAIMQGKQFDQFVENMANGHSITEAARIVGTSYTQGRLWWADVRATLGPQAV